MDFQGSRLPRSNDISDAGHPKRRRLCDNSFEEVLPYSHTASNPALVYHEYGYTDLVVVGEEEIQVQCSWRCESNVEASLKNVTDNELLECCYGMVGSYMSPYYVAILITFSSCLIFVYDFDILQTCNCHPIFPLPFEPPTYFPH